MYFVTISVTAPHPTTLYKTREKIKNRTRFDLWNKSNKKERLALSRMLHLPLMLGEVLFFWGGVALTPRPTERRKKMSFSKWGGKKGFCIFVVALYELTIFWVCGVDVVIHLHHFFMRTPPKKVVLCCFWLPFGYPEKQNTH